MADLEFFFDPVCPWAWITSRWVDEVQRQRGLDVRWRFISLRIINENLVADWYTDDYKAGHLAGTHVLRVAAALRAAEGEQPVGALYTSVGERIHLARRLPDLKADPVVFCAEALEDAGLPVSYAESALDESLDAVLRDETELAFSRTGRDVGTPIITFDPGTDHEASLFGPVIRRIPRGDEATRLWDAVEVLARSGVSEIKRSIRGRPEFD